MISLRLPYMRVRWPFRAMSTSGIDQPTTINIHEHKLTRPTRKTRLASAPQGSLIPETLREMLNDTEFQAAQKALKEQGQKALTREERKQRQRALDALGVPPFHQFVKSSAQELVRKQAKTLQLNIGLYCNQACSHCHVESSPKKIKEVMSNEIAQRCIHILKNSEAITTVDITGGAPELCPEFRYIVEESSKLGKTIIDRCNLTALLEPGQEDTAHFLSEHKVQVVASLPCYSAKNVNLQRGSGVFQRSISALQLLNDLGYGIDGTGLKLDLVYNPLGAFLPPEQSDLETKYKAELKEAFDIDFNSLYTMTNMPIKRFADFLHRRDELHDYMDLLVRNFSPSTLDNLMCVNLINVSYEGLIYDCDFNQQLALSISGNAKSVFDIESCDDLLKVPIKTDNHCYGCTAGKGSS